MMTGIEFTEVRDVLARAFSADEFDMFLYERLNYDRQMSVADGPFKLVVTNVLKDFERAGRDPYLIAEVAAARPLKTDVQEVYRKYARAVVGETRHESVEAEKFKILERYGLAPVVDLQRAGRSQPPVPVPATHEGFEKRVKVAVPWLDPLQLAVQAVRQTARVCLVEVDRVRVGTGFLVGPNAVLTNYHVLEPAIRGKWAGDRISCLFDYQVLSGGGESEGTRVGLPPAYDDWHLDSSPPLAGAAEFAGDPLPTPDQLDHALIRLARPLGGEPAYGSKSIRGWVRVPATAPPLEAKMPLMILQHPKSQTIKLAMDTDAVLSVNANRTRVRYTTNTDEGSSGAPCYDLHWKLVALHHFGESGKAATPFNQGVPIEAIRDRLVREGKDNFLGDELA